MTLRIAMISPQFPPDHCGVADYTAELCTELRALGHSCGVWTAQEAPSPLTGIETQSLAMPWNPKALKTLTEQIKNWKPDAVVIQYTPYLFAPKNFGIHPLLPLWIGWLKRSVGVPVCVIAHELHYPLGLNSRELLIGVPQWVQFHAIALAADRIFFTYQAPQDRFSRRLPWKKKSFHWLPVGANIDPDRIPALENAESLFEKAGIPEDHCLLLQFGSSHPSRLFQHSYLALERALKLLGPAQVSLGFVGLTDFQVSELLSQAGKMELNPHVKGLGYLKPAEVSAWLKRANLILAPFIDGVSTRRGSVMAALAHGKAVLTTVAESTDPDAQWEEFCAVVPPDPADLFADEAVALLGNPPRLERLGEDSRKKYLENFSWPVIARKLCEGLQS